jgi:hypothetical protein
MKTSIKLKLAQFASLISSEIAKWAKVLKKAGIKP